MSFQYPAHPNTNRTDPFQDAEGKNPFADAEATAEKASDSPDVAPATSEPLLRPADAYQLQYPHRGRTVFWLGLVGFCCACGAVLASAGFLTPAAIGSAVLTLLHVLSLIVSLSAGSAAWMFGHQDSKAIRAGAMDPGGLTLTRRGCRLGVAGVLISIGMLAAHVVGLALR